MSAFAPHKYFCEWPHMTDSNKGKGNWNNGIGRSGSPAAATSSRDGQANATARRAKPDRCDSVLEEDKHGSLWMSIGMED